MLFVVFFALILLIAVIVLAAYVSIHVLLPVYLIVVATAWLCAHFGIGTRLELAIHKAIPGWKGDLLVLVIVAVIVGVVIFFAGDSKTESSWVALTEQYDIRDDAEITNEEYGLRLFNFADTAMIGVDLEENVLTNLEADYGFSIYITDDDTAWVSAYDHTDEEIVPLEISVQRWDGDTKEPFDEESVKLSGFREAPDGLGFVRVSFSNGDTLELGIIKQDNELKAFNISSTK